MANRPRALDPLASPAALFGSELRALRQRRSLSPAAVGRLVHVSGDLIGKIEKADRRPQRRTSSHGWTARWSPGAPSNASGAAS